MIKINSTNDSVKQLTLIGKKSFMNALEIMETLQHHKEKYYESFFKKNKKDSN